MATIMVRGDGTGLASRDEDGEIPSFSKYQANTPGWGTNHLKFIFTSQIKKPMVDISFI